MDLEQLQNSYKELASQYNLDPRDIEMLLLESLIVYYGSENITFVGKGIAVEKKGRIKYYNIQSFVHKKMMEYFAASCNQRRLRKNSLYLEKLLSKNNYVIYGKVDKRDSQGYTVLPMRSKNEFLEWMEPIYIKRKESVIIPEYIQLLPIELKPMSRYFTRTYKIGYKADYLNRNLCDFHLSTIVEELKSQYRIIVYLKGQYYKNGFYSIKDMGENKELQYKIVNYVVNYFKQFQVKAVIKTKMIR